MAYGKKYILSFVSDRGNDYRVEMLQQGYTGAAVDKSFGAAPVLNIEDGDGRVKGSSLAFSIQADTEGELSGLYTTNNKEYKVLLYRNNSLYWQGYLLPELYAENYVNPPYDVEVTATDQLATLKDVAYKGEDVQTSLLDMIKGILLNTQLDIPCKIHMQLTTAQGALLSTSYISAAAYNGQNCYDVLNAILLSCNCSIMQMANEWVISSLTDATTSYTTDAGVVNVPHCTIGQMGAADVCPEGSLTMVNAPALKGATVEYNHSMRNSMLINANCVNRDGWRYVPGGVQDRFPGEIDMGDAIYKCYFWLLKQKNLKEDNALQIWQDVELAHDVDNAYTLSFKYMFMSEADSLLLSVAYGSGDGTTLYLTTSGWKTGLDRYDINSYIQITGKNGNYGSVREIADTSKYESTTVKFMLPEKAGALRIGFINCTSDYSDPFFTRDILITDVYFTVDNVTGKTSTTLVEPNATSAQEEVAIVYGEPITSVNADKLDMSYLRTVDGAAVESVVLSGKEYSSYYLAMVQEYARYYGVKKMQLQGALMGADVLHPLYADVHSGKVMRLVNGQYNLLEDSVSVSLEEVPSAFVDYELVVYAKENTPEKNTTTSAGVAVGGGGGESYLSLQGDGDVYVKQERSLVGKEARFDNVALPVAAPVRTFDNTYIYSSDPAALPSVDIVALVASIAGLESHFDGDVAKEAAKVSHAITFEGGAFSADSYNGSAAKTVKIPTTTEHITESGENLFHTASRARAAITGAASSIVSSNLTENRALISNASGKVAVSAVTSTELGYLSGVTSKVQDQIKSITDRIDILEALGLSLVTKDGKTYVCSKYSLFSEGGLTSGGIGSGGGGGTGGGSNVTYRGEYTSGILLGKVTIDGVAGNIYAPSVLSAYTNDVGYITSSALDGYLPKSGGKIESSTTLMPLSISAFGMGNRSEIGFLNGSTFLGSLGVNGLDTPVFRNSSSNIYNLYHTGNFNPADYLPKSGGTIKGTSTNYKFSPLWVDSSTSNAVGIDFLANGVAKGHIGWLDTLGMRLHNSNGKNGLAVKDDGTPIYYTNDGATINTLIHTGNYSTTTDNRYLQLSGGRLSNGVTDTPLYLRGSSSGSYIGFDRADGTVLGYLGFNGNKEPQVGFGGGVLKTLIHSGNYSSYALPLSGGTLTRANSASLNIKRTGDNSDEPCISYQAEDTIIGSIGIKTNVGPFYWDKTTVHPIIHSGNIGSYNAGSATKLANKRTIWGKEFDGTANITGNINIGYNKVLIGDGTEGFYIGWGGNNQYIYNNYYGHVFYTKFGETVRIEKEGNVLIGATTDNGVKLQVNTTAATGVHIDSTHEKEMGVRYAQNTVSKAWTGYHTTHGACFYNYTSKTHAGLLDDGIFRLNANTNSLTSLEFKSSTADLWQFSARYTTAENGKFNIYYSNGSTWTEVLSLNKNGTHTMTGNFFATGGMTSGKASDRRLKQNIMNLQRTNAVNVLSSLRPVAFEWNATAYSLDQRNNGVDVGFIADEYEGLIPNSGRAIWEKYRAIEYEKCIPHLVLGWQIHDDRFVIHENRFETVEDRLAKAEGKIKELEEELKQYKTAA